MCAAAWQHWWQLHFDTLFLFLVVFVLTFCTCTVLAHYRYDSNPLLELWSSVGKDSKPTFEDFVVDILPWVLCLPGTVIGKHGEGSDLVFCAGPARDTTNPVSPRPRLWVFSLRNGPDDLLAQIYCEQDTRSCCVFAFMETWLEPSIPDCVVAPDDFTVWQLYRTESHLSQVLC